MDGQGKKKKGDKSKQKKKSGRGGTRAAGLDEEALKANGVRYTAHIYPGTNHGFHNDTTPRYDEEAAKLAWERTLAFFEDNLR